MKFKVDENLPVEVVGALHAAGQEASTVVEQGLRGHDDAEIAEVCRREGRILVSLDLGFSDIRTCPPGEWPRFVVLRLRRQDKPHLLAVFQRALALLGREQLEGCLWIVEEARVRIRGER